MSGCRNEPIKSPIILFNPTITSIQHDNLDYSTAQPIKARFNGILKSMTLLPSLW